MNCKITFLRPILLFLSFSISLFSQTIYVPTDYQNIQDAIDAADSGDVVIIEEGTYYQQFSFKGKAITVGSEYLIDDVTSHISKTIIDGSFFVNQDSSSLVYFISGEGSNSVLGGLTLQNGKGTYGEIDGFKWRAGGAIEIDGAGATIRDNIIKNCRCVSETAWNFGGGIDCVSLPEDKSLRIISNLITGNEVSGGERGFGGAIECEAMEGNLLISENRIFNNICKATKRTFGGGIGILFSNSNNIVISNNYIKNNVIGGGSEFNRGGGIHACNLKLDIFNNLIVDNNYTLGASIEGGGVYVAYYITSDPAPEMMATINNNTIINNRAALTGGGIHTYRIDTEIRNNIIRGNESPNGEQLYFRSPTGTPIVTHSNIEGGYEGEGNIDQDPQFCDTVFCLLAENISKCIDAGNPDKQYNDVVDGVNAVFPALGTFRNDMGAFGGPHSKWAEMSIIPNDPDSITAVNENFAKIPEEYSLSQNYPNPFNPSTTIKYCIPIDLRYEYQDVRLSVFDILGREIVTLVNQKQKPGNYEVEFDGTGLSSGIYFYILTASEFVETKKMILLK